MNLKKAYDESMQCTGHTNKEYDVEYSLTTDHETKNIIIAFQGSGSKIDWLINFDILKIPYRYMKPVFFVHRGFLARYKAVQDDIHEVIAPLLKKGYTIDLRGFSQGCTTAILLHEDIAYRYSIQANTIVFASPRVFGWWSFKVLKKRLEGVTLVINKSDIVPRLPLFIQGFIHYGNKIKLGKWKLFLFPWNWVKEHLGYRDLF